MEAWFLMFIGNIKIGILNNFIKLTAYSSHRIYCLLI